MENASDNGPYDDDCGDPSGQQQVLPPKSDGISPHDPAIGASLADMHHEIRNETQVILGVTNQVLADQPDARLTHQMTALRHSAENMYRHVSDLLDLARMESGYIQVSMAPFRLDELLSELQATALVLAAAKEIEVQMWADDDLPQTIIGDARRLRQVMLNLVGNAIAHTDHGLVSITIEQQASEAGAITLRWSVRDDGVGLGSANPQQLFQRFDHGTHGDNRHRRDGVGLGLGIVRRLVEAMGGTIAARNRQRRGAEFWCSMRFPVLVDAAPTATTRGGHVLVVDDKALNCEVAVALLESLGCSADTVANGMEALAAMRTLRYDLVLMDLMMPEMHGDETTRLIRGGHLPEIAGQIPIVAMTGCAEPQQTVRCFAAGMNDVLIKPIERRDMELILRRWLPGRTPA